MQTEKPKVSVIVPVYNVEKYIERCAKSLFEQTYDNIEFVFVDDCSNDKSIIILRQLLLDYPKRISHAKIINHDKNRGVAAARNTALEAVSGDFIVWIDSDDWMSKNLIEDLLNIALSSDADIVLSGINRVTTNGITTHFPVQYSTPKECVVAIMNREFGTGNSLYGTLYRNSIIQDYHIRCIEGCNHGEDMFIKLRCFYYAQKIAYSDKAYYYYDCTRNDSITSHKSFSEEEYQKGFFQLQQNYEFFAPKGKQYVEALKYVEFLMSFNMLVKCIQSKASPLIVGKLYNEHLNRLPTKFWKKTPWLKRLPRYIHNYTLLCLYFQIMGWMKHVVLRQNRRH